MLSSRANLTNVTSNVRAYWRFFIEAPGEPAMKR